MSATPVTPTLSDRGPVMGRFSYRPSPDSWEWSDGMYLLHGFAPGQVVPTTELVLHHIHPEDRDAAWVSRQANIEERTPFTFPHRLIDAQRKERHVIAAGHVETEAGGLVVSGHLVDVTGLRDEAVSSELDHVVDDFVTRRAVIEQAKGMLMHLYRVDADQAWGMLRAYSQNSNQKVRDVAEMLTDAAALGQTPNHLEQLGAVDALLRTLSS